MKRFCYFCRKPLRIEKRAEMFCGLRCQKLYTELGQGPPGKSQGIVENGMQDRTQEGTPARGPHRREGRPRL